MNEYLVGDIVWAKLTGYPWWPAKVVDEKSLNKRVLAAKPKSSSTVWPVLFFGSFDYGWFGHENLCYFDEGLAEHGSLNRRGNLFAQAVKQAQDPQSSEDFEESDEKPAKPSNKRSTRPGSQNVSRNLKRNPSPAPKEKKAKTEKETSEPASDQSNSTHSSPARRTPAKRSRTASSRNSKESIQGKTTKLVTEKPSEKAPEHPASKTIAKSTSPPSTSPLLNSPKPRHQPSKKNEEEEVVPKDILEMRALRVSLQKATFPANYKDPELIDKILTILENGDFSPECIIAAKMAKLMRHIHSHTIPKNKYNFSERIRLLGIRFKAATDPKSSDSIKDSKASESAVQSSAKKTKGHAKSNKSSSFFEPANDRESETDLSKNKEVDEAILSLISEPNEKDDTIDYSSEKNISKQLISDNSNAESLPDATKLATKLATENVDSPGFLDVANNLKELDTSKPEDLIKENPLSHQKVSKIITSQASSPHAASSPKPNEIHNSLNDGFFKPEPSPISSELAKESTSTFSHIDSDRGQKVASDENLSSESNLDNLSVSAPLSLINDATESTISNGTGSKSNSDKQETDSETTPLVQPFDIPSTQVLESASGLNEKQTNCPLGRQNKDPESSFNQGQVSSDETKVESSHDIEKEASTVSPPSVASPVAERTSITADSPSSSRATITSL